MRHKIFFPSGLLFRCNDAFILFKDSFKGLHLFRETGQIAYENFAEVTNWFSSKNFGEVVVLESKQALISYLSSISIAPVNF